MATSVLIKENMQIRTKIHCFVWPPK